MDTSTSPDDSKRKTEPGNDQEFHSNAFEMQQSTLPDNHVVEKPADGEADASRLEVDHESTEPADATAAKPEAAVSQAPQITYPSPLLASIIYIALLLAMFLVALDMSIIATAIPTITREFHSTDQIGWYGSAFFVTLAAFQTFWGKAYKYFPLKIVFLICIAIFEVGSLIVAVSPSSTALIVGRAIQGVGGAGVTGGCYTICAFITRPKQLATILGLFSTVWSCSSVLGPVLGGFFTQDVTWRWCFYINLPIGGTTMGIILLFFKTPPHSRIAHATLKELPFLFDLSGVALLVGSFVCLLLALEDGGVTIPWSDSTPIGLLVGFVVIAILFVLNELYLDEKAMIVPRIFKRRTIWVLCLYNFCSQGAGFARNYNLPIFFQAAQGVSPSESGIRTLATVLTVSIFSFMGSVLVGKIGYYQPFLWLGAILLTVGSGLIYTLTPDSSAGEYIGYQVVVGAGSGLVIQLAVIVAQAIAPRADMSVSVAIALFSQFVAGTVGVSAAQNIMDNVIIKSLPKNNPAISPAVVLAAGSTGLRKAFPNPDDLKSVVSAYMDGLRAAWIWSIALAGLSFIVAFGAEWKSVRVDDVKKRAEAKAAKQAEAESGA